MKVERGGKSGGGAPTSSPSSGRASRSEASGPAFATALEMVEHAGATAALDELLRQIEEQADVLVKHQTVTELTRYRELVTGFMKKVLKDGFQVEEIPSAHFMETNKVFVIARRIQEKIEKLAEGVATRTADATAIAAATSEIRGLLLDLTI